MALFDFLKGGSPQDQFAKLVIARFKARGIKGEIAYDPGAMKLTLPDGQAMTLGDHFRFWTAAPSAADKAIQIETAVDYLLDPKMDENFDVAAPYLMPWLTNRAALANRWASLGREDKRGEFDGVAVPFCDDMIVLPAVALRTSFQPLTREKIRSWGVSPEAVAARALENLRAASPRPLFRREAAGYWTAAWDDGHAPTRLLLPELFEGLELRGDPVAVAYDRDRLLVAGSQDPEQLAALTAAIQGFHAQDMTFIATRPVVLKHGAWSLLDTGSPPFEAMDDLRIGQALIDDNTQGPLLTRWLEFRGEDLAIAALDTADFEGRTLTHAGWIEAKAMLLPRADYLGLQRAEGEPIRMRAWDEVAAIGGLSDLEPGTWPPLYRVDGWTPDLWDKVSALPVPAWWAAVGGS
jgi:hypothetical protein